jgi:hypothetical protein
MLLREFIFEKLLATPADTDFDIRNTLFFNILRANPLLARFYADLFRRHGANPSLISDLENEAARFFAPGQSPIQPTTKPSKGSNMAANPNTRVCSHIKVNGVRCGSPSLRGEVFCYFHQRMISGVRTPPKSRLHPIANFESHEAIQASLMEVVNALVRNHIDVPRARLILRALAIAARHSSKVRFDCWESDMVKEVPQYPSAPPVDGPFAVPTVQAAALTSIGVPQKEESEAERLSNSAFDRYEEQVLREERNRRPPASIRRSSRRSATARARTG